MSGPAVVSGGAAALQAFLDAPIAPDPDPTVVRVEVDAATLVLGSTQGADTVDHAAAAEASVAVVRRRSGGGAVLMVPGAATWLEVVVARDDPRWDEDVGRAFHWLGDVFAAVLADAGQGPVEVHRGPLVGSRWSKLACFAGLGPGEVTVSGKKVVGISQRRSRAGARFQCVVMHHHQPEAQAALLRLDAPERAALVSHLRDTVTGVAGMESAALAAAVARAATARS